MPKPKPGTTRQALVGCRNCNARWYEEQPDTGIAVNGPHPYYDRCSKCTPETPCMDEDRKSGAV